MTIKRTAAVLTAAAISIAGAYAWQAHGHGQDGKKTTQITGQVVDTACFMGHDSSGEKHAKCAEACARAGNVRWTPFFGQKKDVS